MKRFHLILVATAVIAASASAGSADAREASHAAGRSSGSDGDTAIAEQAAMAWASAMRRKAYSWPDQRYYGAHGMVSN